MGVTAPTGPIVVYGQGPDSNPERGPSAFYAGTALLDPRPFYTYHPGQRVGSPTMCFTSNTIEVINQIPAAAATEIIAPAQVGAVQDMALLTASAGGVIVGASVVNPITGLPVTGLLAIDGVAATVGFGDVGAQTMQAWDARTLIARSLTFTSVGNDSLGFAIVHGFDIYGFPMTETVALSNASTATGKKAFKYIKRISLSGVLSGSNITATASDIIGLPLRADFAGNVAYVWNGALTSGSVGLTAADTTNPATALTGDVRGTLTVSAGGHPSDGTTRLQVFVTVSAYNLATASGLFGVSQF